MKIYIIGSPASGKTTLSKVLSSKYNIKRYELDCIIHDDINNHLRRTDKEILVMFGEILNNSSWIIEDIGRSIFEKGRKQSDKIYYIKLSLLEIYKRVIKRWINQKRGKEEYNYPPTIFQLFDMLKGATLYRIKEKKKLQSLEKYQNKIEYLDKKKLNEIIKNMI